jgi:tetratricopeptide (TPR) repeat protein
MVYYSMGDYIQAETIYKKSANLLKEALGENHPMYVDALMRLSALYLEKQETANSESLLLEALAILKNTTGENTSRGFGDFKKYYGRKH